MCEEFTSSSAYDSLNGLGVYNVFKYYFELKSSESIRMIQCVKVACVYIVSLKERSATLLSLTGPVLPHSAQPRSSPDPHRTYALTEKANHPQS